MQQDAEIQYYILLISAIISDWNFNGLFASVCVYTVYLKIHRAPHGGKVLCVPGGLLYDDFVHILIMKIESSNVRMGTMLSDYDALLKMGLVWIFALNSERAFH
jgi:hypothetical protein